MLALGWIFGATLLLSIQNASTLPTTNDNTVQVERLHTNVVTDGQPPPPCVNEICPQLAGVRAVVPAQNMTSNMTDPTHPHANHTGPMNPTRKWEPNHHGGNSTNHVSDRNGTVVSGGYTHPSKDHPDVPCSSSDDESQSDSSHAHPAKPYESGSNSSHAHPAKPDESGSNSSHPHSAKAEHLRAAYRIVGQAPPPCRNHICPLTQTRRAEVTEDPDTKLAQPQHQRAAFKVSGNETVPASCRNGKVRCLSHAPTARSPKFHAVDRKGLIAGADDANSTAHLHRAQRNATCRPSHYSNHSSNATAHRFPGTRQTAPITCGDGTKPPCGGQHLTVEPIHHSGNSSNGTTHFPGTHQTAPITCGDGTKPPCGGQHMTDEPHSGNSPNGTHFPGTHQTAPITCGDGRKPPCGDHIVDAGHHPGNSSNGTHFPGTHQTAPITCGDGSKPPCGYQHPSAGHHSGNSSNGTTHFPGTHQTAPITCGDGRKPPCTELPLPAV